MICCSETSNQTPCYKSGSCQLFRMRFRIGWKQQPAVPVPTWFATIHVARQPQIACLPLICLYIHSLLSLVYIDQNAIIECRVCVLDRDQPESNSYEPGVIRN